MRKFVFNILLMVVAYTSIAQTNQKVFDEIDAYVARTTKYMGNAPYAVVISKNGKIIHEKYSQGGGQLGVITENAKWQLFSISKSFASALVLTLVEQSKIKLDDKVGKYLPEFNAKGNGSFDRRDVSIRHLMSHTSGAAVAGDKVPKTNPQNLNDVDIITAPGKDFQYSGLGMHLLERTIEAAMGQDYGDLLQRYVLDPLDLKSASFVYTKEDISFPVLPLRPNEYYFSKKGDRPGTGLFINARDLNKFGQFWLAPQKLFSNKLRSEAWKWHGVRDLDGGNYGLLWWLFEEQDAYVMSGHQYKINAVFPSKGVVVSVLRLPQNDETFEFWPDKFKIVTLGKKIK
jgi:CubicO group peptidase (beta-lactamase class C family)